MKWFAIIGVYFLGLVMGWWIRIEWLNDQWFAVIGLYSLGLVMGWWIRGEWIEDHPERTETIKERVRDLFKAHI